MLTIPPEVMALANAALTGLTPVILKGPTSRRDPAALNLVRFATATLVLVPLAWSDLRKADTRLFVLGTVAAILGPGLAWYIYLKALSLTDVTVVSPLTNAYPLFSAPIYLLVSGVSPSPQIVAGTIAVVLGVGLVAGSDRPRGGGRISLGAVLSIAVAAIWGLNTVLFKLALSGGGALALAALRASVATALLAAIVLLRGSLGLSPADAAAASGVGLLGDSLAMGLMFLALDLGDPYIIVPLTATTPIFASVFAGGLLREKFGARRVAGILLTTLGGATLGSA